MLSNVYALIANATGYKNLDICAADIPLTNLTGTIPGPLNAQYYVPITAPNTSAVGAGGGPVFIASGLDTNFTAASAPAPVKLTAQNETVRLAGPHVAASSTDSSSSGGNKNGAGAYERAFSALMCSARFLRVLGRFSWLESGLTARMREWC